MAVTDTVWRNHGVLLISLDIYSGAGGRGFVFAVPHPAVEAASVLDDISIANTS